MMATIYFIEAPEQNLVKIGRTTNIERRFATLQAMSPVELFLRAVIDNAHPTLETYIHKVFEHLRDHNEWFEIDDNLRDLINNPDSFDIRGYAEEEDAKEQSDYLEQTDDGDYEVVFGKHKGELLSEVIESDYNYIDWVLWKADFPLCVKEAIASLIDSTKEIDTTHASVERLEVLGKNYAKSSI